MSHQVVAHNRFALLENHSVYYRPLHLGPAHGDAL
jgi:hypothetical protein